MKIRMSDGSEGEFSKRELIEIIATANAATYAVCDNSNKVMSDAEIAVVVARVIARLRKREELCTKDEILDMVEFDLMRYGLYEVAKELITERLEAKYGIE